MYSSTINDVPVRTGDVICTVNGLPGRIEGAILRLLGLLVPGEVDHVAVYIGPDGRCVEAGPRGVIVFDVPAGRWDAAAMQKQRWLLDRLYGIADPLADRGLTEDEETTIRTRVADYCLEQAAQRKPYNINFFDSATDRTFYCSQLVYKAYALNGIDLNIPRPGANDDLVERIVLPEEILHSSRFRRAIETTEKAVGMPESGARSQESGVRSQESE